MTDSQKAALAQARKHAAKARDAAAKALDSELYGNGTDTRKHLRAALVAHDGLTAAHEALERSIQEYTEPTHSPPQGPSQTSAGLTQGTSGPPRSLDPEIRRQQDQLASCEIAYRERMRQERRYP